MPRAWLTTANAFDKTRYQAPGPTWGGARMSRMLWGALVVLIGAIIVFMRMRRGVPAANATESPRSGVPCSDPRKLPDSVLSAKT